MSKSSLFSSSSAFSSKMAEQGLPMLLFVPTVPLSAIPAPPFSSTSSFEGHKGRDVSRGGVAMKEVVASSSLGSCKSIVYNNVKLPLN